MKRVLALLSLVCALFLASACHYDVNLSAEADAELVYYDEVIRLGPVLYEGFHKNHLSDNDLEDIFLDLTKNVKDTFTAATLHLRLFDEIGGKYVGEDTYYVVFDSSVGHYVFTDANAN
jgi:hypothetical protein